MLSVQFTSQNSSDAKNQNSSDANKQLIITRECDIRLPGEVGLL